VPKTNDFNEVRAEPVHNAIAAKNDLTDIWLTEFWNYAATLGQCREAEGAINRLVSESLRRLGSSAFGI